MSKEFKVGMLAVVSLVILYFGFNFLKGDDLFTDKNRFYIVYPHISGLTESNPVTVNGYVIGMVDEVEILMDKNNQLKVWISVDDKVQVGDGTTAQLSPDLLGGMSVKLDLQENSVVYESGAEIKGATEESIIAAISEKAIPVIDNLEKMLIDVNKSLSAADSAEIGSALSDISASTKLLRKTMGDIYMYKNDYDKRFTEIANNLNALVIGINKTNSEQIYPLVQKMNMIADSLNRLDVQETLTEVNGTVASLNATIQQMNSTNGTLGQLLNSDSLYVEMLKTTRDLDNLIKHIDTHPENFLAPLGQDHKKILRDFKKNPWTDTYPPQ
jgi:phospholipid/cholesterol/gamma-HCH transport system substrate-binding protein